MNRRGRTVAQIMGIVVLMLVLSVVAYFAGSELAKSFLPVGVGITHAQWQEHYRKLICLVGLTVCTFSLAWYLMARFELKIVGPKSVGKRSLWAILGILAAVTCIATPYIYASVDRALKMDISIPLVFVVLYALIGYWGGSIVTTPATYKYTPLGAGRLRAARGRK